MRTIVRAAVLAAAVIPSMLGARGASAQAAASVTGVWEASLATQTRVENGVSSSGDPVAITITLEARGDSVFGVWQRGKVEGRPDTPPRKLAGVFKDGLLTLTAEPQEARVVRNGEESVLRILTSYSLKLEAGALTGTQKVSSEDGSMPESERPFTAKRKRP
jgi:hypothetical protein